MVRNKVSLNLQGFLQVRRSAKPILDALAQQVAAKANGMATVKGAAYEAKTAIDSRYGEVAIVKGANKAGTIDLRRNHTLQKAVG